MAATCDFLGMNAGDKAKFLAETDAIRDGKKTAQIPEEKS